MTHKIEYFKHTPQRSRPRRCIRHVQVVRSVFGCHSRQPLHWCPRAPGSAAKEKGGPLLCAARGAKARRRRITRGEPPSCARAPSRRLELARPMPAPPRSGGSIAATLWVDAIVVAASSYGAIVHRRAVHPQDRHHPRRCSCGATADVAATAASPAPLGWSVKVVGSGGSIAPLRGGEIGRPGSWVIDARARHAPYALELMEAGLHHFSFTSTEHTSLHSARAPAMVGATCSAPGRRRSGAADPSVAREEQ